ncbi:hypothetical protein DSAG12_00570 [Promethearchaeum syntrophicum]|uniref:Uncharacterized protein n=1 Tax=Promethearchaeum syntrophicum TaxID=2594042 RepID=A0A5B9D6Y0_9ARCH|nr:hypothetical protein [Candidatus Prometheoarchaeum syntrophicum]QEE14755.1 hypothetical protein DSAG12_00570 [Candidatus Prometheoarchaeum syntrophicum]
MVKKNEKLTQLLKKKKRGGRNANLLGGQNWINGFGEFETFGWT